MRTFGCLLLGACAAGPEAHVGALEGIEGVRLGWVDDAGALTAYVCGRDAQRERFTRWFAGDEGVAASEDGWGLDVAAGTLASPLGEVWTVVAERARGDEGVYDGEGGGCRPGAVLYDDGEGPALLGAACDDLGVLDQVIPVSTLRVEDAGIEVRRASASPSDTLWLTRLTR